MAQLAVVSLEIRAMIATLLPSLRYGPSRFDIFTEVNACIPSSPAPEFQRASL